VGWDCGWKSEESLMGRGAWMWESGCNMEGE